MRAQPGKSRSQLTPRAPAAGCGRRLAGVVLNEADLRPPSSLDAVVDAIVARRRLRQLIMFGCMLSPAVIPALARAVCDGALTSLKFINCGGTFLDAAGGATLGDALRANSTS